MKSFTIKLTLLLICATIYYGEAGKKYGVVIPDCQTLSTGEVFWSPKTNIKKCPSAAICPKGHKLHEDKIGEKRVCCCLFKNVTQCPNCEMAYANRMPLWYWFNVQQNRTKGPEDGVCPTDKVKRILIEQGKPNKCCCEPRTSPFVPKEMKERRKP